MKTTSKKSHQTIVRTRNNQTINNRLLIGTLRSLQRQWILSFVLVIAGIVMLTNASAWAAPILAPVNQTVPLPTATPTPTPVPTVTPAPTSTPEPDSTATPTIDGGEPVDLEEDDGSFFDDEETDGDAPTDGEDAADDSATDNSGSEEDSAAGDADSTDNSTTETGSDGASNGDNSDNAGSATAGSGSAGVDSAESAEVASTGLMASVAVIVLNIREQPSLESAVLGTVFQDDQLEVLGRNGPWWMVCCAIGSDQPAWVNPDFLEPDFDLEQADELLPVIGNEADEAGAPSGASVQAADSSPNLELTMSLNPRYIWQNLTFELEFVVRNVGQSTVTDVVLRDELLSEMEFITATISDDGEVLKEALDNGNSLISATWAELEANQQVRVAFTLRALEQLEDGYVVDNLAVVSAAETSSTTAGISIGLPPAELPIFK